MTRKRCNKPLQEVSPNINLNPTQKVPHKPKLGEKQSKENTCPTSRPRGSPKTVKSHGTNERHNGLAVPPPSPRSYLDRLPLEILHMICDELFEDDIPALRLQCKYLCEIANPHFLRSVDVRFKKTSIEALLELSKHPILSHNVETIMYEPNMVEKKPRWEWEKSSNMLGFKDRLSDIPPPPKQSASEREWRLFHRTLKRVIRLEMEEQQHTQEELDLAWPIYQRYLQEQDVMIDQDYASQDLLHAFQGLPNLSAIYINYGWGLWPGTNSSNPYEDGLCKAVGRADGYGDTARGLKETMPLLRMLSETNLDLLSLRIGNLNWNFFRLCGDDGKRGIFFGKLEHMVKSLKDFQLVITTWSDIDADDAEEYEDEEVNDCREYLANGVLGRLLASAPDLRKLAISFDASEIRCPIDFKYLVIDTHWQRLHTIKLDSVDAHEDDWMRFFDQHAATIKHLSLKMIRLLNGDWADVLRRMQEVLTLDEMHFNYHLYGDEPEQFWSLAPPGYTSSKDDSVQANRLRWALEEFMVHGGICPLLDEDI